MNMKKHFTLTEVLGKTVMYLSARNHRHIAKVLMPAPDHNFFVVKEEGMAFTQVIHESDVISVVA